LGWEITILTGNTDAAPAMEHVGPLHVTRLPVLQIIHRRYPILLPSFALVRHIRRLMQWHPQVVVTNTRFFSTTLLGVMLGKALRVPILHIDHGSKHIDFPSKGLTWLGKVIDHTAGSWVVRSADKAVGVSKAVASFIRHLGAREPGILYNGVTASDYDRRDRVLRDRLGIPSTSVVITYLGRLIESKGIVHLLNAFSTSRLGDSATLLIAGDGHMMEEVRRRTATMANVRLLGALPSSAVPELLASTDILVHPSAYPEGLPTVLLEAGAAGVAIIATPMGGTEEIVAGPACGILVAPHDVVALVAAIDRLIANQSERELMSGNVRALVRSRFDWSEIAKDADRMLRDMIEPPTRTND